MWHELKYLIGKLNRKRAELELDEEIRTHIELETREKVEAGLPPEEARDMAWRTFGGVMRAKENSRAIWGFVTIESLRQDLRYGMRTFLKTPGFTFVAVLTLALGIGANTAVFSVVNAVLLRPLPYPHSDRLVKLLVVRTRDGLTEADHSYLNFSDYRAHNTVFETMAAYTSDDATLLEGGVPERIYGLTVSADFFKMLGVNLQLGRSFTAADEQPASESVIISYEFWQSRLGGNPNVIGRRLLLDGRQKFIIGVTRADFSFPFEIGELAFFRPFNPKGEMEVQRGAGYINVLGMLKPAVAMNQAEAEMHTIASDLERQYIEENKGKSVDLISARSYLVGDLNYALLILLGSVGFVLLIACANVANLQMSRAAGRGREMAIRAALGASRGRIARQLLTESLMLSLIGGLIGLLIAVWSSGLIISFIPSDIPRIKEIRLDLTVLAFSFAASMLTGVLFGLAPALQGSLSDLNVALKEGGRDSAVWQGSNRLRSIMIVFEVALSLILLIGAGLLIKSFQRLHQTSPGFDYGRVLTASLSLPSVKYKDGRQRIEFYQKAIKRISYLPGVEAAGAVLPLPYSNNGLTTGFSVDLIPDSKYTEWPRAGGRIITPEYIRAMRIPLIEGRLFNDYDDAGSPKVLLINETLARRFLPGQDPIGRRINIGLNGITGEIVGVVGDVRDRALNAEALPEYYVTYKQVPIDSMSIVVRAKAGDPLTLAAPVRAVVREIDKELPVYQVLSMESRVSDSLLRRRFSMTLLAALSGLALILAAVGIFSVMSFLVAQRTHEIGIRTALGAQPRDVLRLIVGQGMRLALIGISLGLALSFALMRFMRGLLYQVEATDAQTFVGVSLILAGVALAACWIPARRAMKVDPMTALRWE